MSKVIITVGIPASGKTTWARNHAHKVGNTVIVSRDDIRHAHNWKSGTNEQFVTRIHRAQIEAALLEGMDVIVADTNINNSFRNKLIKFAHEHGADVEIKMFPCDLDTAIIRDEYREHKVGADVIQRFSNQYQQLDLQDSFLPVPTYAAYQHGPKTASDKRDAIVVDIDGTVAKAVSRSPYDESKVGEDAPIQDVIEIVSALAGAGYVVLFVSGRKDSCRDDTENWLIKHFGPVAFQSMLIMRKHTDSRPDYIVKNEIYDERIIPFYNVIMAFDDRDQVVRHVRRRGITVAQVAPGRF